ncbi:MAG: Crp/Fnr family transcriptional regulator [Bacillota bacterium]|nr:Crp/Fnr family transcriptional regulator [Bacillota bacterium]
MKNPMIKNSVIFRGMEDGEILEALKELGAESAVYMKGEAVLQAGETTERMGLVLDGRVSIESNDVWGNRTVLSHAGRGQFFAETYALLRDESLMVDVVAVEETHILFLKIGRVRSGGKPWMGKMLENLLRISMQKNLMLSARSFHTAPKSVRGRVTAYLNSVSLQKKSAEFDIPFDRQSLADYLNVERSALSKELGKMQREGMITTRKNHFAVHVEM